METKQCAPILFCHCENSEILPSHVRQAVFQALKESGIPFTAVPDLCALAARKDPLLAGISSTTRPAIAACHPRAVKWLFAAGGASLRDESTQFLNMREASVEQLLGLIRALPSCEAIADHAAPNAPDPRIVESDDPAWKPWFPVIDYARCRNCLQCLGFCLFGVYATDSEGRVQVKNPASCKTDCPACARVCPEIAIIFPKYPHAPINGSGVREGDVPTEPVTVDRSLLANMDVLKALRDRGKSGVRFAPDAGKAKALQERLAHLSGASIRINTRPSAPAAQQSAGKKESE